MDTKRSPEVWEQLTNESGRAYEAFKVYMHLPPAERTVTAAWRRWTENPEAVRPSPFFEGWAREHAWPERARTHDHHLELIRRRGMEKAIEEEAEKQAREVEQARGRYNELMTLGYERAVEWLEDAQPADLRAQDAIQIIRMFMDAEKAFGIKETRAEDSWTEEDERDVEWIVKEVDALADPEFLEDENSEESDKEGGSQRGPTGPS
jgi:hypothetical protein